MSGTTARTVLYSRNDADPAVTAATVNSAAMVHSRIAPKRPPVAAISTPVGDAGRIGGPGVHSKAGRGGVGPMLRTGSTTGSGLVMANCKIEDGSGSSSTYSRNPVPDGRAGGGRGRSGHRGGGGYSPVCGEGATPNSPAPARPAPTSVYRLRPTAG